MPFSVKRGLIFGVRIYAVSVSYQISVLYHF